MAIGTGINRLIAVTQAKMQDANDEAAQGADQARTLMGKKKVIRNAKRNLEADRADGVINSPDKMQSNLAEAKEQDASLGSQNPTLVKVDGEYKTEGDDPVSKLNNKAVDALIKAYEGALEDLDSQEKLGNMEIQDLMSRYNQAEQLAGSTFKKKDDADLSIISKI